MIDWSQLYRPFAEQLADLLQLCAGAGLAVEGTEGYRSPQRQAELYARGRTQAGPRVTNARPGLSPHQWGCAVDFVFIGKEGKRTYEGDWKEFGCLVERAGLVWGGKFLTMPDRPHVEYGRWREVRAAMWRPPKAGGCRVANPAHKRR